MGKRSPPWHCLMLDNRCISPFRLDSSIPPASNFFFVHKTCRRSSHSVFRPAVRSLTSLNFDVGFFSDRYNLSEMKVTSAAVSTTASTSPSLIYIVMLNWDTDLSWQTVTSRSVSVSVFCITFSILLVALSVNSWYSINLPGDSRHAPSLLLGALLS